MSPTRDEGLGQGSGRRLLDTSGGDGRPRAAYGGFSRGLAAAGQGAIIGAACPEEAERLIELRVQEIRARRVPVKTGRFQACMHVELVSDGPVTLMLDSAIWRK